MSYYYKFNDIQGNWIFDYIVNEEIRKEGYGIDLLQFALQNRKFPIFATGSGPMALKIELKIGFKQIGDLKKYVGYRNPLYFFTSLFRGIIRDSQYPKTIKLKNDQFDKLLPINIPDYSCAFNTQLLEFGRDKEFLKWRFYNKLHEYSLYKQRNGDNYFVVRTIVKKGITCLVLVDYRCDFSTIAEFSLIVNVVYKLASKLRLSLVLTGSSLVVADDVLEKMNFKAVGRARPIITTEKYLEEKERILNRDFVLVTLADSDGEINW
jgi:hypothetical protein